METISTIHWKRLVVLILVMLMAALECALGRLAWSEFVEYVRYLLAVADGREWYFDDDEPLWRDPC